MESEPPEPTPFGQSQQFGCEAFGVLGIGANVGKLEILRFGRVATPRTLLSEQLRLRPEASGPRRGRVVSVPVAMAGQENKTISVKSLGSLLQTYLEDSLLHDFGLPPGDGPIHYADFGCGTGGTALTNANFVVKTLKTKLAAETPDIERDIVCHFADLPSNNFNALFKLLPPLADEEGEKGDVAERTWFVSAVPGTQYGRMFPRSSLHVAVSTLSLHFLPEVPKAILDKDSPAYNKGHIGVHGTRPEVAEVFAEAQRKALRRFFECRAEEMAPGGVLAFFCTGREDRAHPEIQYPDDTIIFTLHFEKALQELVNEGVIPSDLLDSYNVSACSPSTDDILDAIDHATGSQFRVHTLEFLPDINPFPDPSGNPMFQDEMTFGASLAGMMRGAMESEIVGHLGSEMADALFERLRVNFERDYVRRKESAFLMPLSLCLAVLVRK